VVEIVEFHHHGLDLCRHGAIVRAPMVSNTQQTRRIRDRRHKKAGRRRKRLETRLGTRAFPIHPEGYDPGAADAKPVADKE